MLKPQVQSATARLVATPHAAYAVPIARGINKQTIYKVQSALGTVATGAGGAILRRRKAVFELKRATFESDEIVSHQMSTGSQFGMQETSGKVDALLSPATYKDFFATAVRGVFTTGINSGAIVTVASNAGSPGNFTRSAGSYLTDGFKVWDVVRWVGWTTTATAHNSRNFLITALSATVMTGLFLDGTAIVTKAAGDSVTATVTGKKVFTPPSAPSNLYYTFEEWYPDIAKSEQFQDLKVNQVQVSLPASGNLGITIDFMGLKRSLFSAQQFTSPTVETTTPICTAVNGAVFVNGSQQFIINAMNFSIVDGVTLDGPVVGSDTAPDMAVSRIRVNGQFTGYYADQAILTLFQNETASVAIAAVVTVDQTATASFLGFRFTRCKVHTDTPDDGEKGILRTYQFTAEVDTNGATGNADDKAIVVIQDSDA